MEDISPGLMYSMIYGGELIKKLKRDSPLFDMPAGTINLHIS